MNFRAIAVLLAIVDVRLGKGDFMAQTAQVLIDSAIVGRRAIPIAGGQAGSENKDFHLVSSPVRDRSLLAAERDVRTYAGLVRSEARWLPVAVGLRRRATNV